MSLQVVKTVNGEALVLENGFKIATATEKDLGFMKMWEYLYEGTLHRIPIHKFDVECPECKTQFEKTGCKSCPDKITICPLCGAFL